MSLNHIGIVVASLADSKKFYLEVLAPLGYTVYYEAEGFVGLKSANGIPDLWLSAVKGTGDSPTKGLHLAFGAPSREVVDQVHEVALKAGAKDNGPPGPRTYTPTYYAAYVFDLDGNNLEVMHM